MFESILYEGDEYQRGNLRRAVGTNIETRFNSDVGRETDAHQGDVVLDEIHFLCLKLRSSADCRKDMAQ